MIRWVIFAIFAWIIIFQPLASSDTSNMSFPMILIIFALLAWIYSFTVNVSGIIVFVLAMVAVVAVSFLDGVLLDLRQGNYLASALFAIWIYWLYKSHKR